MAEWRWRDNLIILQEVERQDDIVSSDNFSGFLAGLVGCLVVARWELITAQVVVEFELEKTPNWWA